MPRKAPPAASTGMRSISSFFAPKAASAPAPAPAPAPALVDDAGGCVQVVPTAGSAPAGDADLGHERPRTVAEQGVVRGQDVPEDQG